MGVCLCEHVCVREERQSGREEEAEEWGGGGGAVKDEPVGGLEIEGEEGECTRVMKKGCVCVCMCVFERESMFILLWTKLCTCCLERSNVEKKEQAKK